MSIRPPHPSLESTESESQVYNGIQVLSKSSVPKASLFIYFDNCEDFLEVPPAAGEGVVPQSLWQLPSDPPIPYPPLSCISKSPISALFRRHHVERYGLVH